MTQSLGAVVLILALFIIGPVQAQEQCSGRFPRLEKIFGCGHAADSSRPAENTDPRRFVDVAGTRRSYYVYVPQNYDGRKKYPVILAFHGGGGNAQNIIRMSGLRDHVDARQFILIAPNGSGRLPDQEKLLTWNAGNCCGYAREEGVNDAAFVRALLDQVSRDFSVDKDRIFLTGMSNGGMISYRLACELSGLVAGIAPVVGPMNFEPCRPQKPIPVVMFYGTADEHVLYNGGKPLKSVDRQERIDQPVSYAVDFWVKQNHCAPKPRSETIKDIVIDRYTDCAQGADVVLYSIIGGQHAWPGGQKGSPRGDTPTATISATGIILDFFLKR